MRGRTVAVVVLLWGVVSLASPVPYSMRYRAGDDSQTPRSGAPANDAEGLLTVKIVAGTVKFVDAGRLVLEIPGSLSTDYIFSLLGATIKVAAKEGKSRDLGRDDFVSVLYAESEGQLIAKTVTVLPADEVTRRRASEDSGAREGSVNLHPAPLEVLNPRPIVAATSAIEQFLRFLWT